MYPYVGRHCDLHTETEPNNPVITCNLFVLIMLPLDNLDMEASKQKSSRKLLLTVLSSKDSDRLQRPNKILNRLFFFSQVQFHCCHTMFLQEKNKTKKHHSITIFKSNVIHHGYTVVAVLRGNHLTKEHGS